MNANKLYNHIFIPLINIFFHTFVTIYFKIESPYHSNLSYDSVDNSINLFSQISSGLHSTVTSTDSEMEYFL